ncbi:MAG: glycosyltransferase [Gaiellaceae bacterium]
MIHFWLPETPPGFADWDPDLEPRRFADGVGHNVIELYRRLAVAGVDVSLGSDVAPGTRLLVLLAGRAARARHVRAALRAVQEARGRFVVIRSDSRGFDTFPIRPLVEYVPNAQAVVHPWQRWLPPLPQRGLRPREKNRYGRIARVAFKGFPENVPAELLEAEWREALGSRGITWWLDVPELADHSDQSWHDFSDVDLTLCLRNPALRLDIERKPATRLINSWVAGCVPVADPEPAYAEIGRDGQDVFFVDSVWSSLDVIDRLNSERDLLERVERAIRERGDEFSVERVLEMWRQSLVEVATRREASNWRRGKRVVQVAAVRAARSRALLPAAGAIRHGRALLRLRTRARAVQRIVGRHQA